MWPISFRVALWLALLQIVISCSAEVRAKELYLECDASSPYYLDSGNGFRVPYPRSFETSKDGSEEAVWYKKMPEFAGRGDSTPLVSMWIRKLTSADLVGWRPVRSDHPNAALFDIVTNEISKEGMKPMYYVALRKEESGLVVASMAPVNIESILECIHWDE